MPKACALCKASDSPLARKARAFLQEREARVFIQPLESRVEAPLQTHEA